MSMTKTPTSSLTGAPFIHLPLFHQTTVCSTETAIAGELLLNRLWYQTITKIEWLVWGDTSKVPTTRPSQSVELPQELVEMIVSHLIYDKDSLLACSMTCCSWYTAAVPHLHHSLTVAKDPYHSNYHSQKYSWPKPLRESYRLGLLPLVKRFRIRLSRFGNEIEFTPNWLGRCTLRYFSALTNLQELGIDNLQVSRFMPNTQQCFGHFSPTLRFLALKEPNGSSRQILYFIGLFQNLQDLKFLYPIIREEEESTADATLVPLSIPPLRGRLILTCFTREKIVEGMITLFPRLRFRYMELYRVKCAQLLLGACADTLETLRLYPCDTYSE